MHLRRALLILPLLAVFATGACSYLRDKEPWDQTVRYYNEGLFLKVEPLVIQGDANYGLVNVVNDTNIKRGFAIRELAIFEEIFPGTTVTVQVSEARDGTTYTWTDHINPLEDGSDPFEGKLVVQFVDEEFRNR